MLYTVENYQATCSSFTTYAPLASLKPTFVLCLATVLLLCVAIAARAPFEGVTTFDSYRACA